MRHLFVTALACYAFSAMDLQQWVHVPQSIVHWLEHHAELAHGHGDESDHHLDHEHEHGDHEPFNCGEHGPFAALSLASVAFIHHEVTWTVPVAETVSAVPRDESAVSAYTGSKWNPPRFV